MKAYISLGANLGDRRRSLKAAIDALNRLPATRVTAASSVYETAAVGVVGDQPDYLNMVLEVETGFSPTALLGICLGIEAAIGRERGDVDKAPRVIDMDLLLCGEEGELIKSDHPELMLPHPRMFDRAFVLQPLAEVLEEKTVFGLDFSKDFEKTCSQQIHKL